MGASGWHEFAAACRVMAEGDALADIIVGTFVNEGEKSTSNIQSRAPKKTGFMASEVKMGTYEGKPALIAAAPYSGFQEFGTRYISGRHFFGPEIQNLSTKLGASCSEAASGLWNVMVSSAPQKPPAKGITNNSGQVKAKGQAYIMKYRDAKGRMRYTYADTGLKRGGRLSTRR